MNQLGGAKKLLECHFVDHECDRKSCGTPSRDAVVKNLARSYDGRDARLLVSHRSSEFENCERYGKCEVITKIKRELYYLTRTAQ